MVEGDEITFKVSWNPDVHGDDTLKTSVKKIITSAKLSSVIEKLAQQAKSEKNLGYDTEHIVHPSKKSQYYIRIWYDKKTYILVEDIDDGEVCYLTFDHFQCQSYDDRKIVKVDIKETTQDDTSNLGVIK